jgi:hypothetical protein
MPKAVVQRRVGKAEDGVALTGEPLVELHHGTPHFRISNLQVGQPFGQLPRIGNVLGSVGDRHSRGAQELAAATL